LRLKERFLREARLLSKIGHPSICQVYDLIETPEADFLVLEYVQGRTLRQLASEEELSFERKLAIAGKIAVALAAAHREKIVHRDLKADNVMVTPEGEVKVLDFGVARSLSDPFESFVPPPHLPDPFSQDSELAETIVLEPDALRRQPRFRMDDTTRLTRMGTVVGTLCVMSPEQASGQPVTAASDLFSFGILLQELFTGQPAYETAPESELIHHVVQARTRQVTGLDSDLARLIQDLQSLDPRRRPTAGETAERLRWVREKPQRQRRQRLRAAAVASAFVFLLLVLAVVSWLAVTAERARREAEQRRDQAESLIGFMIGDLRTKLEAVDRLDILDSVGDRALAYFDQVPEEQLTDEELSHHVKAVTQIGEIRYSQGNLEAALKAFRQARDLGRDLVARSPSNEELKLDEALAEWQTLDPARARSEARAAAAVLGPLLKSEVDEPTRGLIAEAEVTLGRTEAALGAPAAARQAWERALAILEPCPRPLTHWKVLSPWVQALVSLGRAEEARPAVERLQKMGYRNAAIEEL
jgi:serine/threonine protein kinase